MSIDAPPPVDHPPLMNIRAFCRTGSVWEGEWPRDRLMGRPESFDRLAADASPPGGLVSVRWRLRGSETTAADGAASLWLHVDAQAVTTLVCQRCLAPATVEVNASRAFRFVQDEAVAEAEDDECEEDVLALEDPFDWVRLLEDELILSTPLVPMHGQCPDAPVLSVDSSGSPAADRVRPFADLRARLAGSD